jgi:GntR family transcriptional repressor for pyruvate dehydrogenase complex
LIAGDDALRELAENAGDTAAWMSADTRFHSTLIRAARNPYLASIYESVHATLVNYEYRAWIDSGTVPEWLEETEGPALVDIHAPILQAVRNRDPEGVRLAVLRHHDSMSGHLAASRDAPGR